MPTIDPSWYLVLLIAILAAITPLIWCLWLVKEATHWIVAVIVFILCLVQPWLVILLFLLGLYLVFDKDAVWQFFVLLVLEVISGIIELALLWGALSPLLQVQG